MKKKMYNFVIMSVLFILIFPVIRTKIEEELYNNCNIIIETMGINNSKSNGKEVWIDGISVDGKDIDLSTLKLEKGWESVGRVYSIGDSKYCLKIEAQYKNKIEIRFIKHPYSGIVKVVFGDKEKILDLFAEEEKVEIYTIE